MSGKGRGLVDPASLAWGLLQSQGLGEPLFPGELTVSFLGRAPPGRLRAEVMRNSWHEGLAGDPTPSLPLGAVAGAAGGKAQDQARHFHGAHRPKVPTAVVPGECWVRKEHVLVILGVSLGTEMWQPRNCCQAVASRLAGGRRRRGGEPGEATQCCVVGAPQGGGSACGIVAPGGRAGGSSGPDYEVQPFAWPRNGSMPLPASWRFGHKPDLCKGCLLCGPQAQSGAQSCF